MIIIYSVENDNSTNDVIDWIKYISRKDFIRINGVENLTYKYLLNINNPSKSYFNSAENVKCMYTYNQISSIWFRRSFNAIIDRLTILGSPELVNTMNYSLNNEILYVQRAMHHLHSSKFSIGDFSNARNDKINTLLLAKDLNINIPETIITNNKHELTLLCEKLSSDIITKAVYNLFSLKYDNNFFQAKTIKISLEYINRLNEKIFPVLAQECIEKQYEIRSFYIKGKFFSMAIFSQANEKTSIDYRNYDFENPNRTVPYKLPIYVEEKLMKLMDKLNLNTGSIDLIKSKNGLYYFLEVNPVGQFGMVSIPCNYYIEEHIAELLSN